MSDEQRGAAPADVPADLEPAEGKTALPEQTEAKPVADEQQADASQDSAPPAEGQAAKEGEPPAEGEDETDGEGKPRKLSRYQRERRAKIRALERAELAERELEAMRRPSADRQGEQTQETTDPEPREQDFNGDWMAYDRAHRQWEVRKEVRDALKETTQKQEETTANRRQAEIHRELVEAHQDREDEARERIPDYDSALQTSKVEVAQHVGRLILESEKSALIAYHLSKHEGELREINSMGPLNAARAIGRLEARLSLPQAKKTTQAPPPVTPPKGGSASPPADVRKLADADDISAFAKAREAETRKRA